QSGGLPEGEEVVTAELLDRAVAAVLRDVDPRFAGFGGAPKFPPSAMLEGLLRHVERTGDAQAREAVVATAVAMGRGGIYDQLRGGFARYSVDAAWVVPHFEKMLYDNAQLLRVYAHLARLGSSDGADGELPERIMDETARFILDDMGTGSGGFASGLDADTPVDPHGPGVEGATYVWTPQQLIEVLGPDDGVWAAGVFGVTERGNFEHGASALTLPRSDATPGSERFERVRNLLRQARDRRPQPARDDKVVTAWNGMAITALAEAGAAHRRADLIEAAARCARMMVSEHVIDGRLRRASLGGATGSAPGVLEDYAWLSTGLLALHQATGEFDWLTQAQRLLDTAITHFADDAEPGSWFDTADDAESLISRPRDPMDGATPSGASAFAEALLTASSLSEPSRAAHYRELARATLDRAAIVLDRAPRAGGHWLAVAEAAQAGPLEIAISLPDGGATDTAANDLVATARRHAPGGTVIVAGQTNSTPLLADRPPVGDRAAAYVCRHSVCDLPRTEAAALRAALIAQESSGV
uniref:thioredoxin domain-containing protein n=1 Tax=Nocardia alni TaxID=2815723 RepID=UPI001C210B1B